MVGRLVVAMIAIVVLEISCHIVLALESKPEPKDERDALAECKAYRNDYFQLASGAFTVIAWVIVANLAPDAASTRIAITNFITVHLL